MRLFRSTKRLAALTCCALLLSTSIALFGSCSLAAYSETRSFRDALDGRSMEDAISGPVDKDTSSYGDRTSSMGPGTSGQSGQMQPSSSPMMLTIPANGNLDSGNSMGQQQQPIDEQQQKTGSELEREAGPIGQSQGEGDQQQPMEQQPAKLAAANRQPMRSSRPPAQGRNLRQQQAERSDSVQGTKATGSGPDTTFGEEPATATAGPMSGGKQNRQSGGYGAGSRSSAAGSGEQKQMEGSFEAGDEQQQRQVPAEEQQQVAAKQRAMAAMLMSMNNGMKYSQSMGNPMMQQQMNSVAPPKGSSNANGRSQGYATNDKKPTSQMAQNMMASLANKAAYMQQQSKQMAQMQQAARQLAPPVMMSMIPVSNSNGRYQKGNGQQQSMGYGSAAAQRQSGNLRRAKQRKAEKKMSPSMVNAMLNKMMAMKSAEMSAAGQGPTSGAGYQMKPTMAALMKSPAGAEMLANMVMPQMAGAMAGMPAAKKEQYKRMMMAAIMQQAAAASSDIGSPDDSQIQQQQTEDSYAKPSGSRSRGYSNGNMMTTTTMSPVAMMMSTMLANGRGMQQSSIEEPTTTESPMRNNGNYATRSMGQAKSRTVGYGNKPQTGGNSDNFGLDQQQQEQGGYEQQQREMSGQSAMGAKGPGNSAMNSRSQMTKAPRYKQQQQPAAGGPSMAPMMTPAAMDKAQAKGRYNQVQKRLPAAPDGFGGEDSDEQQREMGPTTMAPMMMSMMKPASGKTNAAADGNRGGQQMIDQGDDQSQMDQMQQPEQEQMMMNMMMEAGAGRGPANSPMNGFRQAYGEGDQQQRAIDNNSSGGDGNKMAGGYGQIPTGPQTKGGQSGYRGPMARPTTMQQSYGANNQLEGGDQQQRPEDGYGAAPMGMAEPFAFDYKIEDDYGNGQYRKEESDKNGVVHGSYGYTDMSGIYRHVEYVADENGFRANIKSNEPGLSSESSKSPAAPTSAMADGAAGRSNGPGGSMADSDSINVDGGNGPTDSQTMSNDLSSNSNPGDSAYDKQQQQQQQMLMMMAPTQTELNENGEK